MKPLFDALPDQKVAYLVLRKCGCTSILAAFEKLRNGDADISSLDAVHRNKPTFMRTNHFDGGKDWFVFTIVRDPIRRFLSFYSDKILNLSLAGNRSIANPELYGYRTNMSLDVAIDVAVGQKFESDPHVTPITEKIDQVDFELDFIGKLEEFETSLAEVKSATGIELPILHLNKHQRIPLMLNEAQFNKLSKFYREDQLRYGYCSDYQEWCSLHVENEDSNFQMEEGFDFENEAKLLRYDIGLFENELRITLDWRVHPNHSRKRCLRIVNRVGRNQEILEHLPILDSLNPFADENSNATENISIDLSHLIGAYDLIELCIDIYFWDIEKKKARVLNFPRATRLVLPLNQSQ